MKFALLPFAGRNFPNALPEAATGIDNARETAERGRAVEAEGGFWVGLGGDMFVCSANGKWNAIAERLEIASPSDAGRKSDLHLVMQTGRGFQNAYPDAHVLADKGRYLIVEFDRAEAQELGDSRAPLFAIRPLPENAVVYAPRPRRGVDRLPAPAVMAAVAAVTRPDFEAAVTRLASFTTRLSTSADFRAAAEWARARFEALGLAARTSGIAVGSAASLNVIATKAGTGAQAGAVLVVAHLDSVNHGGGASAAAPGADDNASGAAGVLTLAAAMAPHEFAHDLVFILFGGEEQGLLGSRQYIAELPEAERRRIRAVLNMDMIGCVNSQPPTVMLEGAALSQGIIDALAEAAEAHTTLAIQTSLNPFASDHVPFIEAGIPAVLTIEGADSANEAIHSGHDTLDRLDMDYATQVLRMNAGWLAAEAGIAAASQPDTVPGGMPGNLPVPPAGCGCGCGAGVSPAEASAKVHRNQVTGHYQALFAQYARLNRDGRLSPADRAEWQSALLACGQLDQPR